MFFLGTSIWMPLFQAFLFRAESDVLTAKFAVSMRESSELAQSYADTEARLNALKEKVKRKEGSVEKMQQEIDALGGGSVLDSMYCKMWQVTRNIQNNKNSNENTMLLNFEGENGWKAFVTRLQLPSFRPVAHSL